MIHAIVARLSFLLALIGLVLAGCGGSGRLSQEEYEQRVDDVLRDVSGVTQLGPETPPLEVRDRLRESVEALRQAAGELEELEPPTEVEDAHALLVEGVGELADEVDQFLVGLEGVDDPVELSEAIGDLSRFDALGKLEQAERRFNAQGYTFGG